MSQTTVQEIHPGLYLLRMADTRTAYFEALWEIPEGVTYNAYLLKTPEGAVLFDGWKSVYQEAFLEALASLTPLKAIRHIVIHHMEPDHSGSLPALLDRLQGKVTLWGHPFTQKLLAALYGLTEIDFQAVKSGQSLTFGGHTLTFYHTPWLHWPETMVTHLAEGNLLLTGDIFGGFGLPEGIFDDEVDPQPYLDAARKYTISVIGFYRDKIVKHLTTLRDTYGVHPAMILPAHGLLWRQAPERIIQSYLNWAVGKPQPGKIAVVYSSMYRYVERGIGVVVDEFQRQGYTPVVHRMVDEERGSLADMLSDIADSEAVVLGTETYEADIFPLTAFLLSEIIKKANFAKPLLVLGVFGWAPAAGRKLRGLLESSAFDPVHIVELKGLLTREGEAQIRAAVQETVNHLAQTATTKA